MTQNRTTQLFFHLSSSNHFSFDYFVSHSGVSDAVFGLKKIVSDYLESPHQFFQVYVYGPHGSGKTHLFQACRTLLEKQGVSREFLVDRDIPSELESGEEEILKKREAESLFYPLEWTANFIADYETLRSRGGISLISAHSHPNDLSIDSHLSSRLLAGHIYQLFYPREEELEPLLCSLLERYYLRFSPRDFNYLLQQLPANPLSFDNIFAKINEISFAGNRPAKRPIIKEALELGVKKKK